MSQNDYVIANQSAPNFRSDLNDALQALASLSSGSTAPSTTYANMLWYDTANNILKMRSEADDAWIDIGYLDQSANAFRILDNTQVVNTSGTQTGLLGDQSTATWESGTSTTESLVSPAKVKAAVEELVPAGDVKAWVKFSGTGTVSVSGSKNVSSITDLGTGSYRVNFTTSLSDANYAVTVSSSSSADLAVSNPTTSSFEIDATSLSLGTNAEGQLILERNSLDVGNIYAAVFR